MQFIQDKFRLGWGLIPVMLAAVMISAQCASPGEESIEPVPVTPVALSYVSWFGEGDPWGQAEQAVFKQFENVQPNITVSRQAYVNSTREHLTASPPPDLIFVWPDYSTLSVIKEGLVLDVSNVWEESGMNEVYPAKFENLTQYNGRRYYLPAAYSWTAIYYNQEVFTQYNLTPPESWAEFLEVSEALRAHDITPIALAGNDPWVATLWFDYLNMRLNGPEFHTRLLQGQERYDDPRVRQVFETWQSLLDNNYIVANSWDLELDQTISLVIKGDDQYQTIPGEAGMVLVSSAWLIDLPPKFRDELDFFRFPVIDSNLPIGEIAPSVGYIIPSGSSYPSQATELLAYMSSVEGQTRLIQQFGSSALFLPTQAGVDEAFFAPEVKQGQMLVQKADYIGNLYFDNIPTAMRGDVSGVLRRFLRGSEDIANLLSALESSQRKAFTK
jgi:multiple sugar transport system substrate-binding protein/raffinose/stachyose/melibiose transport system substrate-binding protein